MSPLAAMIIGVVSLVLGSLLLVWLGWELRGWVEDAIRSHRVVVQHRPPPDGRPDGR